MLTTGADVISGTSGNDTINGLIDGTTAANNTFTAADVINGGAGTDTLQITAQGGAITLAAPSISNVETVNIRAVGSGAVTGDASLMPGVTTVASDRSTQKVNMDNLATGAVAKVIGDGIVANGDMDFSYTTLTDAVTLTLDGGVKQGTFRNIDTAGGGTTAATTATINSTGAANTATSIDLSATANSITSLTVNAATNLTAALVAADYATTAAITVAGAASKVDLGSNANVKTIDASGLTAGGLTIALGTNTTSFKGGQGNDTVTAAAVGTTTAGAIDAGAGTGDRLINTVAAQIDTAAEGAVYTNFEIFRNGAAATQDVSLVAGITSVETSASGAGFNKLTAGQAAAVTNLVDNNGATFALATATGTSDVLSVTLANATATASADLTGVTVTGFETMNVVSSSGSSTDINSLSFTAAGDLTALNISGAKPIIVATANITKAAAINASGITFAPTSGNYALTLSGNLVKGSSVTGSGAADSITATAAITGTSGDFVTYDAGAGDDALSATVAAINNTSGSNGSVKIEGGAGTDTLTLTDASLTMVDANFQYVTGVEKYAYTNTGAISITTGGFFDTNNKAAGATMTLSSSTGDVANTIDMTSFSGAATLSLTANSATTNNQAMTTGSGADTVTVSATGLTSGNLTVNTGGGNDTISITVANTITTGAVTVNAGAGKDSITFTGVDAADRDNVSITISAGQSTLTDFDTITGYGVTNTGTNSGMVLNFDGSADRAADVTAGAVTGYTSAELTYTIATGLLTFSGTSSSGLTAAQKAGIAQLVVTAANAAVVFTDGSDSWVFHNDTNGDSLVKLVGVTAAGLDDAAVTTANFVTVG